MAQTMTGNGKAPDGPSMEPNPSEGRPVEVAPTAEEPLCLPSPTRLDLPFGLVHAGQRMSDELLSLTIERAKDVLRLSAELQASTLDVLRASFQPWMTGRPELDAWQRALDDTTRAAGLLAGTIRAGAERGTEGTG